MSAATDVPRFADLDVEVRDLIAGLTDAEPEGFAVRWRYVIDGIDVTEQLSKFTAVEAELAARLAERDETRLAVIRLLSEAGLSQRAISDAVGLSHQRVHQLLHTGT
ncbi:MAG: winged helix-turn-helix transcriptional regulator [Pseudonocardiaceae bacterium]|nr:winged helix-turn-helix transcriptional regulator [Pseudonocardiaceae bacterium]